MSMTFTDDDLKRLKADLAANRRMEWPMPDCEALVARLERSEAERDALKTRLEAAENVCSVATLIVSLAHHSEDLNHCELAAQLEAWRKAAGK